MMVLVPGPVMIEEFGARRMVYGVCIAIFLFYCLVWCIELYHVEERDAQVQLYV
jgi:hypothetical protein